MMRYALGIITFVVGSLAAAQEQNPVDQGKSLYRQNCATCHGQKADKSTLGRSAKLRELSEAQFIEQLTARRDGSKPSVASAVKSRLSDVDIRLLASYVAHLRSK